MEIVYLSNGQSAYLKEKIGARFIVNKIFEYETECGLEETKSEDLIVDEIFTTKPVAKIDSEIKELEAKKQSVSDELDGLVNKKRTLLREIELATKTHIDSKNFILNKNDLITANSIAFFEQGRIMPTVRTPEEKNFRGLKLSMEFGFYESQERFWGYKMYFDYNTSGNFLCPKYGVLINPTSQMLEEIILKRLSEFEFSEHEYARTEDKYLSEKQLEIKATYLISERNSRKNRLIKEIEDKKLELESL